MNVISSDMSDCTCCLATAHLHSIILNKKHQVMHFKTVSSFKCRKRLLATNWVGLYRLWYPSLSVEINYDRWPTVSSGMLSHKGSLAGIQTKSQWLCYFNRVRSEPFFSALPVYILYFPYFNISLNIHWWYSAFCCLLLRTLRF